MIWFSVTAAKGLGQLLGFIIVGIQYLFTKKARKVDAVSTLFYPAEWIRDLKYHE